MATELAPTKFEQFQPFIIRYAEEFGKALPPAMGKERFLRMALTYINANPYVLESDPMSIAAAMMVSAQLGLAPDGSLGAAYLVPYYSSKQRKLICQLIIGYRGYIQLVHNAKDVTIEARVVREGDEFEYEYGDKPFIRHRPKAPRSAKITHAYAVCRYPNGLSQFEPMDFEELNTLYEKAKVTSKGTSPWCNADNYPEMCKKSAVRRLAKYLPVSSNSNLARANRAEDEPESIVDMAMAEDAVVTGPQKNAGTEALKAEIKGEKESWDAPFGK